MFDLLDSQEPCPSNNNKLCNVESKILDSVNNLDDIFGPIVSAPILLNNKNVVNTATESIKDSLISSSHNELNIFSTTFKQENGNCGTNTNRKELDDINFNSISTQGFFF